MYFFFFILDLNTDLDLAREEIQAQHLAAVKCEKKRSLEISFSVNRINELSKINEEHQKVNGKLREKLSRYEDKADHYRRNGVI
jgi:hypothetical protein